MKNPVRLRDAYFDAAQVRSVTRLDQGSGRGVIISFYGAGCALELPDTTFNDAAGAIRDALNPPPAPVLSRVLECRPCPHCTAWRRSFTAAMAILFILLLGALLTGCESVNQSTPVKGAALELRDDPAQMLPSAAFAQGQNADSPSTYRKVREGVDAQGNKFFERTDVKMGTVRDPIITVAEGAPWGEWIVAAIGAISLIGGGVLLYNGWPKVGTALAAGGAIAMVVALTVDSYGYLYAIAILGVGGFAAWTLWSGYKSGLKESSKPATTSNADSTAAA